MLSPTGLIPWFSKTEGNTYATLLHHPFLFKGKPTHAQEVARRISGAVAGEVFAQVKTYQVPIANSSPSHYIIWHLPLVFLSPTSPLPFYSPSLSQSPSLSFLRLPLLPVSLLASLKIACITVSEQITAEQLIQKRIVMKISKAMIMNIGITSVSSRPKRFYIYYYYSTHRPTPACI